MRIIRQHQYETMPWKNGKGSTREIISYPPLAGIDSAEFLWRLSIADVATDGPFSRFAGIERTLLLLEGAGMTLTVGKAAPVPLSRRFAAIDFPGDEDTTCELLAGATRDLNIMSSRARCRHHWKILDQFPVSLPVGTGAHLVICLAGTLVLRSGTQNAELSPLDTALLESAVEMSAATANATALHVRIDYLRNP